MAVYIRAYICIGCVYTCLYMYWLCIYVPIYVLAVYVRAYISIGCVCTCIYMYCQRRKQGEGDIPPMGNGVSGDQKKVIPDI